MPQEFRRIHFRSDQLNQDGIGVESTGIMNLVDLLAAPPLERLFWQLPPIYNVLIPAEDKNLASTSGSVASVIFEAVNPGAAEYLYRYTTYGDIPKVNNMTEKTSKEKSRRQQRQHSTVLAIPGFGLSRTFEDFMKPFDDFMAPLFPSSTSSLWAEFAGKQPTMDIQDRGDHYNLTAELPGFDKKDVEVRISSNVLELKAEKRSEEDGKKGDAQRRRSSYSFFHRYLTLPERVVSDKIDGIMKNGVLELKLPKAGPMPKDSPRKVHLN